MPWREKIVFDAQMMAVKGVLVSLTTYLWEPEKVINDQYIRNSFQFKKVSCNCFPRMSS